MNLEAAEPNIPPMQTQKSEQPLPSQSRSKVNCVGASTPHRAIDACNDELGV